MTGPHLGGQEYAIALTSDHAADEFLGATVAVQFRRVDERHPKRKTSTQRFFLNSLWMSSLCELRGALAQRRGDDAVAELDRSPCAGWCHASGNIKSGRPGWPREHSAGDAKKCPGRHATPVNLSPVQQPPVHVFAFHCAILFHYANRSRLPSVQRRGCFLQREARSDCFACGMLWHSSDLRATRVQISTADGVIEYSFKMSAFDPKRTSP